MWANKCLFCKLFVAVQLSKQELLSLILFANFATGSFYYCKDTILIGEMSNQHIYRLMWIGWLSLVCLTGCRPAERRELKIPPLPAGEQTVIQTSLAALTDAIDDEPGNGSYYFRRALLYEQSRRYEEALRDVKQAIEYRSTGESYGRYYVLRGRLYLLENKIDSAYADAVQSEKLGVQSAAAYLLRGQLYTIKQQYNKATAALNTAQQMTPYNPQIYYWQANAAAGRGDTTQAIAQLTAAIKSRPDYIQVYNRFTEIYTGLRDYATAKQYAFTGLKIDSSNVYLNNNLGKLYRTIHQTDSAIICFRRSLKKDTAQYPLNYDIGMIYLEKKYYWAAIPYFEKLTTRLNKYPQVPEILAVCYDQTGQERYKLESWQATLQADSTDWKTQRLYEALARRVKSKQRQAAMDSLASRKQQLMNISPVEIKPR